MCKRCRDAYNKRAVRKAAVREARRHCSDCGAVEDLSAPKPEPFHVKRSGQVICQPCNRARYKRAALEAAVRKAADGEVGRHRSDCGAVEDISVPKPRLFLVNRRSGRVMCKRCRDAYNKAFCKARKIPNPERKSERSQRTRYST